MKTRTYLQVYALCWRADAATEGARFYDAAIRAGHLQALLVYVQALDKLMLVLVLNPLQFVMLRQRSICRGPRRLSICWFSRL